MTTPPRLLSPSSTADSEQQELVPRDPWGMQTALNRMLRSISLPKPGFRELYSSVSNRWVEQFGKPMDKASWHLAEGLHHYTMPWAPSAGIWFFSFLLSSLPSVGAAPFPVLLALFLEEWCCPLPVTGMLGTRATGPRSPPDMGESSYWGKWSWWWGVGGEIQQLLDLCEATFESAVLGSPSNVHSLDLCDMNQVGRN